MAGALIQMTIVLLILSAGGFFIFKKIQKNMVQNEGEQKKVRVEDRIRLNHQIYTYYLNVDGEKLLVVATPSAITTTKLNSFSSVVREETKND